MFYSSKRNHEKKEKERCFASYIFFWMTDMWTSTEFTNFIISTIKNMIIIGNNNNKITKLNVGHNQKISTNKKKTRKQ